MDQASIPAPNPANTGTVFALILCLGFVIVIVMILFFSYLLSRYSSSVPLLDPLNWDNHHAIAVHTARLNHDNVVIGIDDETLDSLPKMLYSKKVSQSLKSADGKELDEAEDKKCCSICLSNYKESDVVRVMPDCSHMFHMNCIDEWIRVHRTCPICRTSLFPSLLSSPLARDAPLTVHGHDSTRPFHAGVVL